MFMLSPLRCFGVMLVVVHLRSAGILAARVMFDTHRSGIMRPMTNDADVPKTCTLQHHMTSTTEAFVRGLQPTAMASSGAI